MKALLVIITSVTAASATAQENIGTTGAHYTGTQVQLSCTIGEPVVATVTGSTATLTQGFEQPWADVSTAQPAHEGSGDQVVVYPNPTRHALFVALGRSPQGEHYTLFDAVGKLVTSGTLDTDTQTIGMEGIGAGNYQLVLNSKHGTTLGTFRIIVNH